MKKKNISNKVVFFVALKYKKYIIGISLAVLVVILIVPLIRFLHIPENWNGVWVDTGCGQFTEEKQIVFNSGNDSIGWNYSVSDGGTKKDFVNNVRYIVYAMRSARYKKTELAPTECQAVVITIKQDKSSLVSVTYAYDFEQKKVFVIYNDVCYEVNESKQLKGMLCDLVSWSLFPLDNGAWRAQSTFCREEFAVDTESTLTFRYNLHWCPQNGFSGDHFVEWDYKNDGFKVSEIKPISDACEALRIASNELDYISPVGLVYFDETCGYWMVEIIDGSVYNSLNGIEDYSDLDEKAKTVIISNQGEIIETYTHCTSVMAFSHTDILTKLE